MGSDLDQLFGEDWLKATPDDVLVLAQAQQNLARRLKTLLPRSERNSQLGIPAQESGNLARTRYREKIDGSGVDDGIRTHNNRNHNPGLYR